MKKSTLDQNLLNKTSVYQNIFNESLQYFYLNFNVFNLSFVDFEKLVSGFFYHAISSLLVMPDDIIERFDFRDDLILIPSDLYLKTNDNFFRKVLISNGLISDSTYPTNNFIQFRNNFFKKIIFLYSKFKLIIIHDSCLLSYTTTLKSGFGYFPNLTRLYYRPKIVTKNRTNYFSENKYIQILIELYPIAFFEDSENFVKSSKKISKSSNYFQGIGYFLDPLFFFSIIVNKAKIIGLAHGGSYDIFKDDIPTKIEKRINSKFFSWISHNFRIAPIRFFHKNIKKEVKLEKSNKILWIGSANVTSKNIYSYRLSEEDYNKNVLKIYNFLIKNKYDFCYKVHPIGAPDFLRNLNIEIFEDSVGDFNKFKLVIFDMPDATLIWFCISHNINFIVFFSNNFLSYFSNDFKKYQNLKDHFFLSSDKIDNLDLNNVDNSDIFKSLYGFKNIADIGIYSYFKNLIRL